MTLPTSWELRAVGGPHMETEHVVLPAAQVVVQQDPGRLPWPLQKTYERGGRGRVREQKKCVPSSHQTSSPGLAEAQPSTK